jgi:hypothetical protein
MPTKVKPKNGAQKAKNIETKTSRPKKDHVPKETPVKTETLPVPVPKPAHPPVTPVTPIPKSWQKQETHLGPWAQIITSAIERLQQIARAIGRYETFVLALVILGTYSVGHANTGSEWAISAIIAAGMAAPLVALWVRKKLATPRVKPASDNKPECPTAGMDLTRDHILDA